MEQDNRIPKSTITRLSLYCRQLELLESGGYPVVSSEKLALLCQVNSAQVRKDLGYFGEFGIRGVGYNIKALQAEIKKILATNRQWNMAIVGIGNLGSALIKHSNFPARNFNFVAAFDNNREKTGNIFSSGLEVMHVDRLKEIAETVRIDIGVITTPYSGAQETADRFIDSGINAILNFSQARIHVPEICILEDIDFTVKLDILTCKLKHEIGVQTGYQAQDF